MKSTTDQTGRTITLPDSPKKIISLVPSQTELLYDLGLDETVAGITKFCVHPDEWFRSKKRIGGTKKLNMKMIRAIDPDLIIANKEENEKSQVEALSNEFPVWISDIHTLAEAKQMILAIGTMTGKYFESLDMVKNIDLSFDEYLSRRKNKKKHTAIYLIWNDPMMVAGGDTFISSMMNASGLINAFQKAERYPVATDEMIRSANPEIILLSSEPYPFREKHLNDFKVRFPESIVLLADGEMFSWYGSRLKHAPAYFPKLFEQIESVN